jgi:hypothetical protein
MGFHERCDRHVTKFWWDERCVRADKVELYCSLEGRIEMFSHIGNRHSFEPRVDNVLAGLVFHGDDAGQAFLVGKVANMMLHDVVVAWSGDGRDGSLDNSFVFEIRVVLCQSQTADLLLADSYDFDNLVQYETFDMPGNSSPMTSHCLTFPSL